MDRKNKVIYTKEDFPLIMKSLGRSISTLEVKIVQLSAQLKDAEAFIGHNLSKLHKDDKIVCRLQKERNKNKKVKKEEKVPIRKYVATVKRKLAAANLELLEYNKIYNISHAVSDNYDMITNG